MAEMFFHSPRRLQGTRETYGRDTLSLQEEGRPKTEDTSLRHRETGPWTTGTFAVILSGYTSRAAVESAGYQVCL